MHMASTKSTVDHLRSIALFSECSTKELGLVVKNSTERVLKAGTIIMDQGQTGREAYVILEGTATVKRNGKKIATAQAGTMVGELSLLDQGSRTATVVCDTECEVLVLEQRKLLAALAPRIRDLDRAHYG